VDRALELVPVLDDLVEQGKIRAFAGAPTIRNGPPPSPRPVGG